MRATRISTRFFTGLPIVATVLLVACEKPAEIAEVIIRPARVIRIADASEIRGRALPGRAEAVEEVNLSFDVPGTILQRPVFVGDKVTKGQMLARLDARDYQNQLDASKAARDRARANFERVEIAATSGAVSRQDLDDARAQLEVRQAEVKIKQKAVEDTTIRAPRAGTISATYVEAFTAVRAKEPILRLLDTSSIVMVVQIPENLISLVPNVVEASVEFDAFPGQLVSARIKEVSNEASLTTRTYPVKLIMDQPEDFKIIPGMAGKARAILQDTNNNRASSFQVPVSAVFTSNEVEFAGKNYVWVVNEADNTVQRREVSTGALTQFGISVPTGISAGDLVVISGANSLQENQEVRPVEGGAIL